MGRTAGMAFSCMIVVLLACIPAQATENQSLLDSLPQIEEITPDLSGVEWEILDQSGGSQTFYSTMRWSGYLPIDCPVNDTRVSDITGDLLKVSASVIYQNISDLAFETADSYQKWSLMHNGGYAVYEKYPGGIIRTGRAPRDLSGQTSFYTSIQGWIDPHTEFRVNAEGYVKEWILDEAGCLPLYVERNDRMQNIVTDEAERVSSLIYTRLTGFSEKEAEKSVIYDNLSVTPEPSPTITPPLPLILPETPVPLPDRYDPAELLDMYTEYRDHATMIRTNLNSEYLDLIDTIDTISVPQLQAELKELDDAISAGKNEYSRVTIISQDLGTTGISDESLPSDGIIKAGSSEETGDIGDLRIENVLTPAMYDNLKKSQEEMNDYYSERKEKILDKIERYNRLQERYESVEGLMDKLDIYLMEIETAISNLEKSGFLS